MSEKELRERVKVELAEMRKTKPTGKSPEEIVKELREANIRNNPEQIGLNKAKVLNALDLCAKYLKSLNIEPDLVQLLKERRQKYER